MASFVVAREIAGIQPDEFAQPLERALGAGMDMKIAAVGALVGINRGRHVAFAAAIRPKTGRRLFRLRQLKREVRQDTDIADMIFAVPEIIAELSKLFELKTGDLIFTGTPAGVGPLQCGDRFHAELQGIAVLEGRIA